VSIKRVIAQFRWPQSWGRAGILSVLLLLTLPATQAEPTQRSDEGAHILALDNSWNRALETSDITALDMLLADKFVSVDIDGSMQSKPEFLTSIKAPAYHAPAQAVTEQSSVEVYGDSAVVVGIFRTAGVDKGKKYMNRERYVDTWVKISGTWKCVASIAVLIPAKQSAH
jgi:ketosteroid isomerase-like protein